VEQNLKRRDVVRALLTPETDSGQSEAPPARVSSGAVRAMGLELGRLADDARAADALRQQIENGAVVVDLPTDIVDPSFVTDRLAHAADAEYRRLVESIRDAGQLVPILVRPHPDTPRHYQIAYGHRRRDAAAELGIAVKAIVRPLSDGELVIAQGKENGERRDLSFIERALFAADLQRRGFDRATLNTALGVHTAEMTRLLAVAASIPEPLIRKIGPAPKAGRFRWQELARYLARPEIAETVGALLAQPSMDALASDRRFDAVMASLRAASDANPPVQLLVDGRGIVVGRVEHGGSGLKVTFDERAAPGLGSFVLRELNLLIGRYSAGQR
jgi:ParB family transcriptional regulator, chromosome partitioning protein